MRTEIEVERPSFSEQPEAEIDESNKPDFIIQYEQTKKENPDGVLLTHIGPFFFAFGKDAEILGKHTGYVARKKNFYGNVLHHIELVHIYVV